MTPFLPPSFPPSLTHSLTQVYTYSLIHSSTHTLIHSLTELSPYVLTFTYFIHIVTHSIIDNDIDHALPIWLIPHMSHVYSEYCVLVTVLPALCLMPDDGLILMTPLIHLPIHALTHSFTHPHSLIQIYKYSLIYSSIHTVIHPLT